MMTSHQTFWIARFVKVHAVHLVIYGSICLRIWLIPQYLLFSLNQRIMAAWVLDEDLIKDEPQAKKQDQNGGGKRNAHQTLTLQNS